MDEWYGNENILVRTEEIFQLNILEPGHIKIVMQLPNFITTYAG